MNPIWGLLSYEEKEFVYHNLEKCVYEKNEIIHHEGDQPTHIMMLVSGKLKVYKEGVGMKAQIIRMLKPYDFFAYRAVIAGETYNTTVSAFEESMVYKIKKEAFLHIVQHNLQFCYQMMVLMAQDLGNSDSKMVNLTQKHIRGRLAEAILSLKENYGYDEDGATLAMYMSREDLANLSNMTTANAIRTLSTFAMDGIVTVDGRKIKILDEDELIRISRLG
ncbi:MAG: Crp/Fnr family transcriptional regulator [Paludibacteraceae bacterium]|nr:Crp/Fnr family transcriptional regulator [Paludibacteraceae bacterium]